MKKEELKEKYGNHYDITSYEPDANIIKNGLKLYPVQEIDHMHDNINALYEAIEELEKENEELKASLGMIFGTIRIIKDPYPEAFIMAMEELESRLSAIDKDNSCGNCGRQKGFCYCEVRHACKTGHSRWTPKGKLLPYQIKKGLE